jgi:replicative DNA helicase
MSPSSDDRAEEKPEETFAVNNPEFLLVAGAVLNPALVSEAASYVEASDIEDERLRRIWTTLTGMIDAGVPVNTIDVGAIVSKYAKGKPAQRIVAQFISKMLDGLPRFVSLVSAAQAVRRRTTMRVALAGMRSIATELKEQLDAPGGIVDDLDGKMAKLSVDISARSDRTLQRTQYKDLASEVGDYFDRLATGSTTDRIPTGIRMLDKRLGGGLRVGQFHVVMGCSGSGKCLGRGTPVLMFDGNIRPVETIVSGDLLMGPDSKPRRVLATNEGLGPLFRISPIKGEPWVCNDVHVLTLVDIVTGGVVDIPLDEHLRKNKTWAFRKKLFSVGVDFAPADPLPIDPYFLGLFFGDGTKCLKNVGISKPDMEVLAECQRMAEVYGLHVRKDGKGTSATYCIEGRHGAKNPLLTLLRSVVGPEVSVPLSYLTASRDDRRSFLAGWLDSDGYMYRGCYDFIQKRKDYAEAVVFLARSLGLRAVLRAKKCSCQNGFVGNYWRVSISGDCSSLPLRIPRKKPQPRRQIKDVMRHGFSVEPVGNGEFFGFTLDGDGRFLLGDFTVTHNTSFASQICDSAVTHGFRALMFSMEVDPVDVYIRDVERTAKRSRWDLLNHDATVRENTQDALVAAQSALLSSTTGKVVYGEPISVEGIRQAILTERLRGGAVNLVVVDHAQVALPSSGERKGMPRYLEVKSIAEGLRAVARRLHVAVLLTAQMNAPAKGEKPSINLVREGKDINMAAEVSMLIWHERQEMSDGESFITESYLLVEKVRAGQAGKVRVDYHGDSFRFEDATPHYGGSE